MLSKKKIPKTIILNKKIGQTPLELINEFKDINKDFKDIKMAYAGRLDPLAYGKMLILVGDECKQRDKYLSFDKEYIFEILLDFKSDSKDVLGIAEYDIDSDLNTVYQKNKKLFNDNFDERFQQKLKSNFLGKMEMEYPIYSSKAVNGKPLFLWALEGKIAEIEIPKKNIEIYKIDFLSMNEISKKDLHEQIFKNINSIKKVTEKSKQLGNDFRRDEIRTKWNNIFSKISDDRKFIILKIKIIASSGTYMRTLAEKISSDILDSYGLAYSINRTGIGKFHKNKFFNFLKDIE